jgi:pimeloyl-ACP methyl ester carboxylesterase
MVLGHSYGAFVVLQNAVDYPDQASQTIVSSGLPSANIWKYLKNLKVRTATLREQVTKSWERKGCANP